MPRTGKALTCHIRVSQRVRQPASGPHHGVVKLKRHPDWPPPDWPERAVAVAEAYGEALIAVQAMRRRISQEAAEVIVSNEYARRGVRLKPHEVRRLARDFMRTPWWPLLHPRKARREGYRTVWPWTKDED